MHLGDQLKKGLKEEALSHRPKSSSVRSSGSSIIERALPRALCSTVSFIDLGVKQTVVGSCSGRPRNDAAPSVLPYVPDGTVLYDCVCILCSAWFKFVAARDPEARFRFTPIQGDFGRRLAVHLGIDPDNPQTNAVIIAGKAYVRSDAALQILRRLPGWSWTRIFLALPQGPRDWFYDRVAKNRYKLFGRTDTCMVPDVNLRRHVLPENTPFG